MEGDFVILFFFLGFFFFLDLDPCICYAFLFNLRQVGVQEAVGARM